MRKALWCLVLFVVPMSVAAGNVATGNSGAAAAFERLKGLAGTWQVDSDMGKGQSVWEVVASGSTVLERFTMDGMPSPMITAYHLDGDQLELTHYCMAGQSALDGGEEHRSCQRRDRLRLCQHQQPGKPKRQIHAQRDV